MVKKFKKIIAGLSFIAVLAPAYLALAASSAFEGLKKAGEGDGGGGPFQSADQYKMADILGTVIQAFLGILGVLFLSYTLYAGYTWMTAQGDEEKVTKAKDTLQRAVIGLIITVAAYAITAWVLNRLITGTGILNN
ncbi:MAG: hypothetical protein Q8O93_02000 [bacterium]|nr:hypothetical protein [bacterium]